MNQRRTRPSFSKDDEERLLAYMQVTRHLSINYAATYGYHSPQYALQTTLNDAIDKLAEQITGDPKFFWSAHHSAGGRPEGMSEGKSESCVGENCGANISVARFVNFHFSSSGGNSNSTLSSMICILITRSRPMTFPRDLP